MTRYTISAGFANAERDTVAALYWEAFSAKLRVVLGPTDRAIAFISQHLDPGFALVARGTDGQVMGIAGFKTDKGALIGGDLKGLARHYGWFSLLWRAPLLNLVERDLADDVLLMDGICVAQDARGMGLGTALLSAIKAHAAQLGLHAVRLDVIDTNPRARALYEREGFAAIGTEELGPFRFFFGFSTSTQMICKLA